LTSAWRVDAGPAYDVTPRIPDESWIAVRTLGGEGEVLLKNLLCLPTKSRSIFLFKQADLARFRCVGHRWKFFWFEFLPGGLMPVPGNLVFEIQESSEEVSLRDSIMRKLKSPAPGSARSASAQFALLLCHWGAAVETVYHPLHFHRQRIDRVIEEMNRQLNKNWPIAAMARTAGLSERQFRQVFREITGHSPKQFYDQLRLQQAYELLQNTICNVGEAAEQLGFSSPFHLSKAFKKQFGIPPSKC
jgi:AraC-like DNA-binding protein